MTTNSPLQCISTIGCCVHPARGSGVMPALMQWETFLPGGHQAKNSDPLAKIHDLSTMPTVSFSLVFTALKITTEYSVTCLRRDGAILQRRYFKMQLVRVQLTKKKFRSACCVLIHIRFINGRKLKKLQSISLCSSSLSKAVMQRGVQPPPL